jgi:hypothetical protein
MKSKDYELNVYADGFGKWHAKATFTPPLGNTGEAERVWDNARRAARRHVINEMLIRSRRGMTAADLAPVKLQVISHDEIASANLTRATTWAETWKAN